MLHFYTGQGKSSWESKRPKSVGRGKFPSIFAPIHGSGGCAVVDGTKTNGAQFGIPPVAPMEPKPSRSPGPTSRSSSRMKRIRPQSTSPCLG